MNGIGWPGQSLRAQVPDARTGLRVLQSLRRRARRLRPGHPTAQPRRPSPVANHLTLWYDLTNSLGDRPCASRFRIRTLMILVAGFIVVLRVDHRYPVRVARNGNRMLGDPRSDLHEKVLQESTKPLHTGHCSRSPGVCRHCPPARNGEPIFSHDHRTILIRRVDGRFPVMTNSRPPHGGWRVAGTTLDPHFENSPCHHRIKWRNPIEIAKNFRFSFLRKLDARLIRLL